MPLDYDDAKEIFYRKLAETSGRGHGRMDAAVLAMVDFSYQRGLEDGQKMAQDADKAPEVFSKA